jgi:predicted MPP superfamily phosphohydrolase
VPLVRRPFVPSYYGERYVAGHVEEDGRQLYVSSGVGTSGLPVRFLRPPEVVILTLRAPSRAASRRARR